MAVVTIAGRVMTSLRVERAEHVAEIENKRRLEAEQERNRLKNLLAAEGELLREWPGQRKQRRLQVEQERDRLLALLDEKPQRSRWKRLPDRLEL